MAAANLVVKMLLDSGAFDTNIKSAQKQMQTFENVGKKVAVGIGKVAGALGIATTAVGTFEKIMRGSQATSDAFDRVMSAATISVDNFFNAISTGDFTAFNAGLTNMINRAKEAYNAFDQLGNSILAWNVSNAINAYQLQDALTGAKNTSKSRADREKDLETAKYLRDVIKGENKVVEEDSINAIKKYVAAGINTDASNISYQAILEALTVDTKGNRDEIKAYKKQQYDEFMAISEKLKEKYGFYTTDEAGFKHHHWDIGGKEKYQDEIKPYEEVYASARTFEFLLNKKNDEELKKLGETFIQAVQKNRSSVELDRQIMEVERSLSSNTNTSSTLSTAPAVEGSLKYINEEIGKVKKEIENINPELNPQKLQELQNKLAELENKKRKIEFEITYIEKVEKQDSVASGKTELQTDGWLALQKPELKQNTNNIDEQVDATEKWAKSLNGVQEAMKGVADTLMITSNMTKEGASAWLTYSANIAMAVSTALPYLIALFNQKARNAIVEQFSTPFGGIFAGIAAATAVAAAIAAIPKTFANGGIVDSPFGVGDRVLARVNGGEMILNKHQQSNLFNLLDNGGLSGINNKVTFEIEGKKLVGVLKNYNNKINKAL